MNDTQPELKELVSIGQCVEFLYFRHGELWYETSPVKYRFAVPITDCGEGTFNRTDKAMIFMRYIRRALEAEQRERNAWAK